MARTLSLHDNCPKLRDRLHVTDFSSTRLNNRNTIMKHCAKRPHLWLVQKKSCLDTLESHMFSPSNLDSKCLSTLGSHIRNSP